MESSTLELGSRGSPGRLLLHALRDAAARGVRVRVLIDGLYTGVADALWLGFAAHEGVQVHLFNPFTSARNSGVDGRFAAAPWDWGRTNRRMHNKPFVADGALALFGGRDLADIYYLKLECLTVRPTRFGGCAGWAARCSGWHPKTICRPVS